MKLNTHTQRRTKVPLAGIDWLAAGLFILLLLISAVIMKSASTNVVESDANYYFLRHIRFLAAGFVLFVGLVFFNYNRFRELSRAGYLLVMALLVLVLVFGTGPGGTRSWLFGFQPSELAKLVVIVSFAAYLEKREQYLQNPKEVLKAMAFVLAPMFLVFIEPDLGTSLVFYFILMMMLFIAGANRKLLFLVNGIVLLLIAALFAVLFVYTEGFQVPLEADIPFLPLRRYQLMRLAIFINPAMDPLNTGYHVLQSKIAIGSGGLFGQGFGNGSQIQGNFLPAHHTDFIFSVIGEEMGFFFSGFVLLIYMFFILRMLQMGMQTKSLFGTLIIGGICSMLVFQVLVNVGMAIGIMPITGLPLPFFTYGGTNLLINMMAIGLVFGIYRRGDHC